MHFELIWQDIAQMQVDAVVNAANTGLRPGSGVCGAIFEAAGYKRLQRACKAIGHCDVGGAVITSGFALPAKYIIHAVGPMWYGGMRGEAELLASCYRSALQLAAEYQCKSVAFPLISTGIYGYPKEPALQIAIATIEEFLQTHDISVYLAFLDRQSYLLSMDAFNRRDPKKPHKEIIEVVAALLWQENRFLLCQRPMDKANGGLWEFPGGKVEPGETKDDAIVREIREELGITVQPIRERAHIMYAYPEYIISLTLILVMKLNGTITLSEHLDAQYVKTAQAKEMKLCPADRKLLEQMEGIAFDEL